MTTVEGIEVQQAIEKEELYLSALREEGVAIEEGLEVQLERRKNCS